MKAKELRDKNIKSLERDIKEKKEELNELRFDVSMKQAKNHRDLRNTKRDIAKMLTVINELKGNEGFKKGDQS
jgi:large subunit ribosomal protein L29